MRRTVRAGTLAVCGVLALALLSGCGDEDSAGRDPLLKVIERARTTSVEYGSRYTVRGRVTVNGTNINLRGYGQTEAGAQRSRVVMKAGDARLEGVQAGRFLYQRVRGLPAATTEGLPDGVRWVKVDQDTASDAAGLGAVGKLRTAGPAEAIGRLAKLDPKIEDAGPERVDGRLLRRYRVTVPARRVFESLADDPDDLPASVKPLLKGTYSTVLWIDAKHLVRRSRVRFEGAAQSFVTTSTVTALDRDLHVVVPSGPSVYDVTGDVEQALRDGP